MFPQIPFFAFCPSHSGQTGPVIVLAGQTVVLDRELERDRHRHLSRRPGAGGDRHSQLSSPPPLKRWDGCERSS